MKKSLGTSQLQRVYLIPVAASLLEVQVDVVNREGLVNAGFVKKFYKRLLKILYLECFRKNIVNLPFSSRQVSSKLVGAFGW